MTINEHPITIPLPIILFSRDRNFECFLSSNFYDENHKLIPYKGYVLEHDKIVPLDEERKIIDLSFTKNLAAMIVSVIILFATLLSVGRWYKTHNYKDTPRGFVVALEMLILYVRNEIAVPNIGKKKSEKFMPYLLTIFFFIWLNNMLGLLPGSANVTGCMSIALCLATFTFFTTSLNGNKHYWGHTFTPPVPKFLWPILIPIEIVGLFTKPITLMIRLVANISSGHIIMISLINFVFLFHSGAVGVGTVVMGAFMIILKLLVCFIQAYVFTLLSSIYIGDAVK
jgi:F-type H+-transporting ATPase subunit a